MKLACFPNTTRIWSRHPVERFLRLAAVGPAVVARERVGRDRERL